MNHNEPTSLNGEMSHGPILRWLDVGHFKHNDVRLVKIIWDVVFYFKEVKRYVQLNKIFACYMMSDFLRGERIRCFSKETSNINDDIYSIVLPEGGIEIMRTYLSSKAKKIQRQWRRYFNQKRATALLIGSWWARSSYLLGGVTFQEYNASYLKMNSQ